MKCDDLDLAIKLYNEALESKTELQGIINNNLGISHFFKFVQLSEKVRNPLEMTPEVVKPILESANNAVKCLK